MLDGTLERVPFARHLRDAGESVCKLGTSNSACHRVCVVGGVGGCGVGAHTFLGTFYIRQQGSPVYVDGGGCCSSMQS